MGCGVKCVNAEERNLDCKLIFDQFNTSLPNGSERGAVVRGTNLALITAAVYNKRGGKACLFCSSCNSRLKLNSETVYIAR